MPEIGQETIDNLKNMCRKHHIHLSTRWHTEAEDWWQATPRDRRGHPFCGAIATVQGYVAGYADAREHMEATIAGHKAKIKRELDEILEEIFRQ